MDIKRTYEFLGRARLLGYITRQERYRADGIRSRLGPSAVKTDIDRVQTSPGDCITEQLVQLLEIEAHISRLEEEQSKAADQIAEAIGLLCRTEAEAKQGAALMGFYVTMRTNAEIAADMHYSVDHIYTLKRAGVRTLADILEKKNRT